ncbi:type 1 glutamine amidotransferase [Micromonospora endolithica]|uniref:Type 1 glutamine amidotransferase n=1 Tax=Micromonospora endolithica TaxID=230091 RepID=A0A3A9ZRS5_9ACTN|nr:type 1 glutamine amidotransferase [Micromonospora endolithica]RKN50919.1 type 1 glutamine amidotransferase [Micromonospora endolithica]TWJ20307.1 GMP synthase-like glutamine amidotransferase [Micromonospora endolithica]
MATALVIENDPTDDLRRLGEWLTEAGLDLWVVRPHAGDELPADLEGWSALVVLGGDQQAYPRADGTPGAPWFPALEGLLRKAVRHRVPTLAICLGAQLLATAHAGTVERSPSGPEVGPGVVGRRDAAERDPLFRYVPLIPDVLQWHSDEITELPAAATLLAASTRHPHQAFRLGDRAWGLQFHIECDTAMIADWSSGSELLAELGYDPELVVAACDAVMVDVEEVWQPFAARFAALALGELDDAATRRTLPLLGQ